MTETKHAAPSAETRAALHEVMAAFEAYKAGNDERLERIEAKRADVLLEDKVARIDADLSAAQARLERLGADARRPRLAADPRTTAPDETKAAWDGYLKGANPLGLESKGLAESATGGYIAPPETERVIDLALTHASPMREIATVQTIGAGVYQKPVATVGVTAGWAAETAARPETDEGTLTLLQFSTPAPPPPRPCWMTPSSTWINGWRPSAKTPLRRKRPRPSSMARAWASRWGSSPIRPRSTAPAPPGASSAICRRALWGRLRPTIPSIA
jgi:hypothetical protein